MAATLFLVVCAATIQFVNSLPNHHDRHKGICLTEHCIEASNRLFKTMDRKADPCEDFSQFACGRFMKEFVLPEDKSTYSAFTPISEVISERGRNILEEKEEEEKEEEEKEEEEEVSESEWSVFKMAKDHYKACMDKDRLETLAIEPGKSKLKDIGGWPVLEGEDWHSNDSWYDMVYKMNNIGFGKNHIFSLDIGTDDKNSSWRTLFLDQPSLGLPREYLVKGFEDVDVQHYFTYMKETAVLFGANPEIAAVELKESLLFELELAHLMAPREERRNHSHLYNPHIIGQFEALPGHPPSWTEYVEKILLDIHVIGHDERIIVTDPNYVKNVSKILANTKPRVIANYLAWQAAESLMSLMNLAARNIRQKFVRALTGVENPSPRWRNCVEAVGFNSMSDSTLRIPAASLYVKRYFEPKAKADMIDMIKYIQNAFLHMIEDLKWMDEKTKERAKHKLVEMSKFIAYPEELLDRDIVEKHHEGLEISQDDYLENSLNLIQWDKRFKFRRLHEKVEKTSWLDHSLVAMANAFYSATDNSIQFPAGILQGAFFDHQVPKYLNFGAIGAVIGHEITHGFDDQGRQFDVEGNLHDWWEDETKKRFLEKANCIIDQYSNFTSAQVGLNLNGINTQGENIADCGGVKEAFTAYEQWVKDNGEEALLPGQDFTTSQLFWISYSQVWCSKSRDEALKKQIRIGYHSPGEFRINGPLSNSPQFAKAFNCPLGSRMNPVEKCTVW